MSLFGSPSTILNNSIEQQEARAFLRERFLKCISSTKGNSCQMKTIELTEISGTYQGMDIHVTEMFVKGLKTPYSEVKNSLIRTSDILYVNFPQVDANSCVNA